MIRNPERLKWIREELNHMKESGRITIGKNVKIHPYVSLGEDGFTMERDEDGHWVEGRNHGNIVIGDNVDIRAFTAIHRATLPDEATIIGEGTKIRNHVNISHNCKIGKHCFIGMHACLCGSVEIGDYCWISPHACIEEHVKVGNNVIVGMGAVVIEDLPEEGVYVGVPARRLR